MNTKHLLRKLPSCLLGAIFVAGVASTTVVNAIDGNPPGFFELEGNTADGAGAGTDWDALYGGATPANMITFTGITADPAPQTIYWKGGSKDINDVTQWWYKDGSVPDKDDITNAYAAAFNNPADICQDGSGMAVLCSDASAVGDPVHKTGDLIVYFGLDRYANDGDAFAGFWFFQDDVGLNGTSQFDGQHVGRRPDPNNPGQTLPGDVLVLVEYPQASGAHPEIKVYEWDPLDLDHDNVATNLDLLITQSNAECDGTGGKLACAISNLDDLPGAPAWPYTPKSGSGLPFESFFEGGINVTRLLGSTPCFASFLAETRASRSETATLKDFVIDEFPVCGIDVEKDCAANLNTAGDAIEVSFFGTLKNTGGSSFITLLQDDQSGSTIDRVCVDTNAPGCADDADVAGLVKQADGSAYFSLAAGMTVRYEGSYSTDVVPPPLTDVVTAEAYAKVADIGNPDLVIVDDSDSASCSFDFDVSLAVFKDCDVLFVNGDSATVTISGWVKNTGDLPLSNVTLSDSDFGALSFPTTLAVNSGEVPFSETRTVPYASLDPSVSGPDANGLSTVTLNHADTVTAQGQALGTDGTTVIGQDSQTADADCSTSFTRGIAVAKDCDQVILEPDVNGKLVVKVKVSATVTNIGDEDLSGIVLSDNPAVVFDSYSATLPGGAGDSFTVNGYYYPTSAIDLTNLTPLSFSDTASVSANGVFSGGASADSDDADCPLCPAPE